MNQPAYKAVCISLKGLILQKYNEQICHERFDFWHLYKVDQQGSDLSWKLLITKDISLYCFLSHDPQLSVILVCDVLNPNFVSNGVHEIHLSEVHKVG